MGVPRSVGQGQAGLEGRLLSPTARATATDELASTPQLLRLSQALGHLGSGQVLVHEIHVLAPVLVKVHGGQFCFRVRRRLIRRRIEQPAFHPNAAQEVLDFGPEVFALLRERPGVQRLIALTNVTDTQVRVQIPIDRVGGARLWRDVLSRARYQADEGILSVALRPYGVAWITVSSMSSRW